MIKKFIQHISEDNKDAMDASLKTLIMTRVNTALDIKRIEMASTVYNESLNKEKRTMAVLVGMSDKNLNLLKFDEFPSEDDIRNWKNFKEKMRIGDAKDAKKPDQKIIDSEIGRKKFITLKLRLGDYTTEGIFVRKDDKGVYFKKGNDERFIPFGAKIVGGKFEFDNLEKISKQKWEAIQKAHSDAMQAHVDSTIKKNPFQSTSTN